MKCKCSRCDYKWTTKGDKEPKSCPGCKSYAWNKKKKVQKTEVESAIDLRCTKCGKDFTENETVYRVRELKLIKGNLVFMNARQQGLYCEDCVPSETDLPFLSSEFK